MQSEGLHLLLFLVSGKQRVETDEVVMCDDHHRTEALKVGEELNMLRDQAVLDLDEVVVLFQ